MIIRLIFSVPGPKLQRFVIYLMNSIDNKKSTFDSFKVETIKYVKNEIIPPMVHIINQYLGDGIMPKLLKIAKVIPVHKGQKSQYSWKL